MSCRKGYKNSEMSKDTLRYSQMSLLFGQEAILCFLYSCKIELNFLMRRESPRCRKAVHGPVLRLDRFINMVVTNQMVVGYAEIFYVVFGARSENYIITSSR